MINVPFYFCLCCTQDPHGSITASPLDNMRGLEYYLHDIMHNAGGLDGQDHQGKGGYFSLEDCAPSIRGPTGPVFCARNRRCATPTPKSRPVFVWRREKRASDGNGIAPEIPPTGTHRSRASPASSPFSARESISGPRDVTLGSHFVCVRGLPCLHLIEWLNRNGVRSRARGSILPALFSSSCRRLF